MTSFSWNLIPHLQTVDELILSEVWDHLEIRWKWSSWITRWWHYSLRLVLYWIKCSSLISRAHEASRGWSIDLRVFDEIRSAMSRTRSLRCVSWSRHCYIMNFNSFVTRKLLRRNGSPESWSIQGGASSRSLSFSNYLMFWGRHLESSLDRILPIQSLNKRF